jgi:hypothetical protein
MTLADIYKSLLQLKIVVTRKNSLKLNVPMC